LRLVGLARLTGPEQRHGSAGALRTPGGLGAISGPRTTPTTPEQRHGSAAALRPCGGLGAISGPRPTPTTPRAAPRLRRAVANVEDLTAGIGIRLTVGAVWTSDSGGVRKEVRHRSMARKSVAIIRLPL